MLILSTLCVTFLFILTGCLGGKAEEVKPPNPQDAYKETFQQSINESNKLLDRYSLNLDKLYIDEYTPEQFGVIVREVIGESNELVTEVDRKDVDPEMFEFHQKVQTYLNHQHELFLTSIAQANQVNKDKQQNFDKDSLRENYTNVKNEQGGLLKEWKEMYSLPIELKVESQN